MINKNTSFEILANASSKRDEACVDIAVNGTLMRGLELESNLVNLGATFVREDRTEKAYRLFSIDDVHPGMVRVPAPGFERSIPVSVVVEIWNIPVSGLSTLLQKEPPGLSIGSVKLMDGKIKVPGVLAEAALVAGKRDISDYPGNGKANFRDYIAREGMRIIDEALDKKYALLNDELAEVQTSRIAREALYKAGRLREAGEALYKAGRLREAIETLNRGVKTLGLKDRLFLNMPL